MRARAFRVVVLIFMVLASAAAALAAKIYLKNGTIIVGDILSSDPNSVTVQQPGLGRVIILRANIERIDPPLAAPAPASPPVAARPGLRVGIALSGGAATIGGGDLNKTIRDWNTFAADVNASIGKDSYKTDWRELKDLMNLRAELVAKFGRHFGLGLGAEYLTKDRSGTIAYSSEGPGHQTMPGGYMDYLITDQASWSYKYTLTLIPLSLSLYGFIPLGTGADIFVGAGPDYYLGTLELDEMNPDHYTLIQRFYKNSGEHIDTFSLDSMYETIYHEKSTSKNWGIHLSGGIHVRLLGGLELFAEALYRWANLKDWRGDYDWVDTYTATSGYLSTGLTTSTGRQEGRDSGTLWYYEYYEPSYRTKSYGRMNVDKAAPEQDSETKNIRAAAINVTGVAARVGIKFSFNLR